MLSGAFLFCRVYFIGNHCTKYELCADPESFVRGGPTLTTFLVDEGRGSKDQNTTKMAFRWRANDGLTLNDGLVAL